MTFTLEQQTRRRTGLGGSEIAAVLGLDPYRSRLDVYLDKKGLAEPFAGNRFTRWGTRLEGIIAEAYAEEFGVALAGCDTLVHPTESWVLGTPDRLVTPVRGTPFTHPLEIKNRDARQAPRWGDAGTDLIPDEVACQAHWYLGLCREVMYEPMEHVDVAALFGGNDFRFYRLPWDAELYANMLTEARDFWFDHIVAGVEPALTGSKSAHDYLARKFSTHTERMQPAGQLGEQLLAELESCRLLLSGTETEKSRLEAELKAAIGEAAGLLGESGRKAAWKLTNESRAVDYEAAWGELVRVSNVEARVLRTILEQAITVKPGVRRFLFTPAKGGVA